MKTYYLLILLSFAGAAKLQADWYPPLKKDLPLPRLDVETESGAHGNLRQLLSTGDSRPFLMLPVFTTCHGSCPLLARALQKVWTAIPSTEVSPRVVLISFDPKDDRQALLEFRRTEKIPASWQLVRPRDPEAIRPFFDVYSYSIFSADGGFAHPSQILVLSADLAWRGSLYGPEITPTALKRAVKAALRPRATTTLQKIQDFGNDPEAAVIWGAIVIVVSAIMLGLFRVRKTHPNA
jgi:cytochrome oxidase Cu insertion factor (SCO1/SenC/PrrC family)